MVEFVKRIVTQEYECDLSRRMRLSYLMRHAQQIGGDHLLGKGISYKTLSEDGMVFLVAKMLIEIERRPQLDERLVLHSIPMQPKGVQFVRDTIFATEQGEQLVKVSIAWVLADPQTHRILRPSMFHKYGFKMNPYDERERVSGLRLKKPNKLAVMHWRQIKYSDLDYNMHVNNAAYADILCDYLPMGALQHREISEFGIIYHKETLAGQILDLGVVSPQVGHEPYYIFADTMTELCFEAYLQFKTYQGSAAAE